MKVSRHNAIILEKQNNTYVNVRSTDGAKGHGFVTKIHVFGLPLDKEIMRVLQTYRVPIQYDR